MGYSSLQACVADLEASGQLRRIDAELDPHLEIAEIQRRVFARGGPALLFTRVRGSKFPLLGNLFKNKSRSTAKTELLIFITPKVVSDRVTSTR